MHLLVDKLLTSRGTSTILPNTPPASIFWWAVLPAFTVNLATAYPKISWDMKYFRCSG